MYNRVEEVRNIAERMSLGPESLPTMERKRAFVEDDDGTETTATASQHEERTQTKRLRRDDDEEDMPSVNLTGSSQAFRPVSPGSASSGCGSPSPPATPRSRPGSPLAAGPAGAAAATLALTVRPAPPHQAQSAPLSASEKELSNLASQPPLPFVGHPSPVPSSSRGDDEAGGEMDVDQSDSKSDSTVEEEHLKSSHLKRSSSRAKGKMLKQDSEDEEEVVSESGFVEAEAVSKPSKKGGPKKITRKVGEGSQRRSRSAKVVKKRVEGSGPIIRSLFGQVSWDSKLLAIVVANASLQEVSKSAVDSLPIPKVHASLEAFLDLCQFIFRFRRNHTSLTCSTASQPTKRSLMSSTLYNLQ
jgi:hypothetical protein